MLEAPLLQAASYCIWAVLFLFSIMPIHSVFVSGNLWSLCQHAHNAPETSLSDIIHLPQVVICHWTFDATCKNMQRRSGFCSCLSPYGWILPICTACFSSSQKNRSRNMCSITPTALCFACQWRKVKQIPALQCQFLDMIRTMGRYC